jgi:hypothetical protein
MEGGVRDLLQILSRYLLREAEKTHDKPVSRAAGKSAWWYSCVSESVVQNCHIFHSNALLCSKETNSE